MAFRLAGIKQLLARHGRNVRINYDNVSDEYNPATGTVTKYAWAPATVRGYFYDTKADSLTETQIEQGTRRLVILPHDINGMDIRKPQNSDKVEGQREKVSIHEVEEIMSGDKTLFYICSVSR